MRCNYNNDFNTVTIKNRRSRKSLRKRLIREGCFYKRRIFIVCAVLLEGGEEKGGGDLQVLFKVRWDTDAENLAYLEELVAAHPVEYRRVEAKNDGSNFTSYSNHYLGLEPNRLYIKVDDDIVYIHVSASQEGFPPFPTLSLHFFDGRSACVHHFGLKALCTSI
jgi:hypothetical protein